MLRAGNATFLEEKVDWAPKALGEGAWDTRARMTVMVWTVLTN